MDNEEVVDTSDNAIDEMQNEANDLNENDIEELSISNTTSDFSSSSESVESDISDYNSDVSGSELIVTTSSEIDDLSSEEDAENIQDQLAGETNEAIQRLDQMVEILNELANPLRDNGAHRVTRIKFWAFGFGVVSLLVGIGSLVVAAIALSKQDESSKKKKAMVTGSEKRANPFEELEKQRLYDALPDYMKSWIVTFRNNWSGLSDEAFWTKLRNFSKTYGRSLLIGDYLVLLQVTRVIENLSAETNWVWLAQDKVDVIDSLVAAYKQGGVVPFFEKVGSLEFNGQQIPRSIASKCAQMALAELYRTKSLVIEEAAAA